MNPAASVTALLILDSQGNKLLSKFYGPSALNEKLIFDKCKFDIMLLNDQIVISKRVLDLAFHLVCNQSENEIWLSEILTNLVESLQLLLKNQLEKSTLMQNIDLVLLAMDEIVDGGYLGLTSIVLNDCRVDERITRTTTNEPLQDQTISQVWKHAQEQLARSFLK